MRVLKQACNYYVIELTRNDIQKILEGVKSSVRIKTDVIEIRKLAGD